MRKELRRIVVDGRIFLWTRRQRHGFWHRARRVEFAKIKKIAHPFALDIRLNGQIKRGAKGTRDGQDSGNL